MDTTFINVRDLRTQLADKISRVAYIKRPVVVTKHGRPVAALVSIEDYEKLLNPRARFTNQADWDKGFRVIDRIRAANSQKTSLQINKLVDLAVSRVRGQSRN